MNTLRVVVKLKVIPVYKCSRCSINAAGQTMSMEIDAINIWNVVEIVNKTPLVAAYMPIGWASFYHRTEDIFICSLCNDHL